jgi:hypothetical protein
MGQFPRNTVLGPMNTTNRDRIIAGMRTACGGSPSPQMGVQNFVIVFQAGSRSHWHLHCTAPRKSVTTDFFCMDARIDVPGRRLNDATSDQVML